MILTLVIVWVFFSVIFFGSLAIAASRPLPPMDPDTLINDPSLQDYQLIPAKAEYAYDPSASPGKFEGMRN